MKMLLISIISLVLFNSCNAQEEKKADEIQTKEEKAIITFVELGSVNCIPCKQMQPVMKAIEEKYGQQVDVIFYDVWTDEHKKYKDIYEIKLIPTQVFLDANGKEIFRHVGFYPESEIDKFLQSNGLKVINEKSKS